jgi:hypothetical protein
MKGRFYQPNFQLSNSEKAFPSTTRPWKEKISFPAVFWLSSIPDRIKMQKNSEIKHISQTNRSKNTKEFLERNQAYINNITDSRNHTPTIGNSSNQSRKSTPDRSNLSEKSGNNKNSLQLELPSNKKVKKILTKKNKNVEEQDSGLKQVEKLKFSDANSSVKNFEPDLPKADTERYIGKDFSIPKSLNKRKKEIKQKIRFKNQEVDKFINRFSKKTKTVLPLPKVRSGPNGWKLVNPTNFPRS